MMNIAYISIGSNEGDRAKNLSISIERLAEFSTVIEQSKVYETAPWGKNDQKEFLNMVVVLNTEIDSRSLFNELKSVEIEMGRKSVEKWGPRLIDLDILYFNDLIVKEKDLTIPHPRLQDRKFVLIPLVEVDFDKIHPEIGLNSSELLAQCSDRLEVHLWTS